MSSIYIHIPFCKKACVYCDFHFSTNTAPKADFIQALLKEIELTADYLSNKKLKTIYFGGGTPSLLEHADFSQIFECLGTYYDLSALEEVTLEANPDDLTRDKIESFSTLPINRFSLGVQSFFDDDLKWLGRIHSAEQSTDVIQFCQQKGFNLTIDLIYGLPGLSKEKWLKNLSIAVNLNIPHISCYYLTVEEKTALHHLVKSNKILLDEDKGAEHYQVLIDYLAANSYEHYEISNFCLPGKKAIHNSNYWSQQEYLGLGPSAHSFNKRKRKWNVSNNQKYIQALLKENQLPFEEEVLTPIDAFNEYLMTHLRTSKGIDRAYITQAFGPSFDQHLIDALPKKESPFILNETSIVMKESQWIYLDYYLKHLFLVNN